MLPPGRPMAVCPILSLLQKVRSCTFCTKLRCSVRYFCIKGKRKISLFIVYSKVSACCWYFNFHAKTWPYCKTPKWAEFSKTTYFNVPFEIGTCTKWVQWTVFHQYSIKEVWRSCLQWIEVMRFLLLLLNKTREIHFSFAGKRNSKST